MLLGLDECRWKAYHEVTFAFTVWPSLKYSSRLACDRAFSSRKEMNVLPELVMPVTIFMLPCFHSARGRMAPTSHAKYHHSPNVRTYSSSFSGGKRLSLVSFVGAPYFFGKVSSQITPRSCTKFLDKDTIKT